MNCLCGWTALNVLGKMQKENLCEHLKYQRMCKSKPSKQKTSTQMQLFEI